jgi:hypothetical protein
VLLVVGEHEPFELRQHGVALAVVCEEEEEVVGGVK